MRTKIYVCLAVLLLLLSNGSGAFAQPTADEIRTQVRELLNEFDSFKDSAEFKQCVYGCGKSNPGKMWNVKRKALQDQMSPQLDAPVMLKAALGEMWQMGMDYAKGKTQEAKELRGGIEKALVQQ